MCTPFRGRGGRQRWSDREAMKMWRIGNRDLLTREHVALQTTDDLPRKVGARSESRVGLGTLSQFRFATRASVGAWLQLLLNFDLVLIITCLNFYNKQGPYPYLLPYPYITLSITEKKRRRNALSIFLW